MLKNVLRLLLNWFFTYKNSKRKSSPPPPKKKTKPKTTNSKNHQDGMSQENRYFKTEICNTKLQDIWVKPFISFLIRVFLFICKETLGSRKAVYLLTDGNLPGKVFVAALGQQADPKWLAKPLLCWKKPMKRKKADSPCSLLWTEWNWRSLCSGHLDWLWGLLKKAGEKRWGSGEGGRKR